MTQSSCRDERVISLGTFDQPVLLFGGCYSNLEATRAMQAKASELKVPPQRVICNGDLVAYCGDPQATVDLIRQWGIAVVQGNCEQSLADDDDDCGCGFDQGSACSLLSVAWYRFARQQVCSESCRWMAQLPQQIRFELAGRQVSVVHGGFSRNNRFLFGSSAVKEFEQELALTDAQIVVGGHCGLPFARHIPAAPTPRHWLNSGVIGMPANDSSRDGWYLLLQPFGDRIECHWQRLSYDAKGSAARMHTAGLPSAYADALLSGIWPSVDVLPELERQQQGVPLRSWSLVLD